MILGLVMYLLVEDTGNIHAQCLDIMNTGKGDRSYGPRGPKVVRSLLIGL